MFAGRRGTATLVLHVVTIWCLCFGPGVVEPALDEPSRSALEAAEPHYLDEWAVHVPGGERHARSVAQENDFKFVRQLLGHAEHFLFVREDHPSRSKRSAEHHTETLLNDHRVEWAEQQVEKIRVKRGYHRDPLYRSLGEEDVFHRSLPSHNHRSTPHRRDIHFPTRDKLSPLQWYLDDGSARDGQFDSRETSSKPISLDVVSVWQRGYTGKGVTVSILDDGLEHDHPDLRDNYSPEASYDLNDHDLDPMPRYDPSNENKHGTRCGGEIAMKANNGVCGVGVAFDAKIGGVRILDGKVTDSSEAQGFKLGVVPHVVDIFSASWGPNDDGKTIEGPGKLALEALKYGVEKGRDGKGVIYVWASGNGGGSGDNCDCDGYTGSIYTLSISSASMKCKSPWYAEWCASTMATTYSSGDSTGAYPDASVTTTDLNNTCTTKHTGTSASAPLAAGVIALVLQANPDLTWRDVQWVTMLTANYEALSANPGWKKNGACIMVNSQFGAGLLDANAMVDLVEKDYQSVPEKHICTNDVKEVNPEAIPKKFCGGEEVVITIDTCGCKGQENEINFLEHVQVYFNITHNHRGNMAIYMQSPQGENMTMLLSNRVKDNSSDGLQCWPFMSVHQFGENPCGEWKIVVQDNGGTESCGSVNGVELVLHGVKEKPWILEKVGCRQYDQKAIEEAKETCLSRGKTAVRSVPEATQG